MINEVYRKIRKIVFEFEFITLKFISTQNVFGFHLLLSSLPFIIFDQPLIENWNWIISKNNFIFRKFNFFIHSCKYTWRKVNLARRMSHLKNYFNWKFVYVWSPLSLLFFLYLSSIWMNHKIFWEVERLISNESVLLKMSLVLINGT